MQVFSCEYCKIFRKTYFESHLRPAVSKEYPKGRLKNLWCSFSLSANYFRASLSITVYISNIGSKHSKKYQKDFTFLGWLTPENSFFT